MRALPLLLLTGCATVFTGTSQKVSIETRPAQAVVVVVGEPAAPLILLAKKSDEVTGRLLGLLRPLLSEQAYAQLSRLETAELIGKLFAWLKLGQMPAELAGENAAAVPAAVKEQLFDLLGVKAVALSPVSVELRKGREYAVIAWKEGYRARLDSIDSKFNWVVLLNVLNAFLGVPVDILTGAWMNLTPERLELTLPEAPPPQ